MGEPDCGWVLYDSECARCIRWSHFLAPLLRRHGFEIERLQAEWTADALGMTREETLRELRLLTRAGEAYAGADVYLFVGRRIWWAWPFAVLFSLPGLRHLLWTGYRSLARNRHCVSDVCKVKSW